MSQPSKISTACHRMLMSVLARSGLINDVRLACVAGSAMRGDYRSNWSDIDVVIVCSTAALQPVLGVEKVLRTEYPEASVGVITEDEVASSCVPPKLEYVLRQVAGEMIPDTYRQQGWEISVVDDEKFRNSAFVELTILIERCRRYTQQRPLQKRPVYKYCTLMAQLSLRIASIAEPSSEIEILRAFRTKLGVDSLEALEEHGPNISDDLLTQAAIDLTVAVRRVWEAARP